ncbi:MAG: hypothetical protein JWL89_245 [Candidatus Saccharibacteria bacterium]|nr:hypothetical protein [Candidatus Saccharibacteria bacterium]
MRRLEAEPLTGFNEALIEEPAVFEVQIGDRSLDYQTMIGNTPAVTSTYDGLTNPQLVLGTENGLANWDSEQYYPVGRLSRDHGRSLEIRADSVYVEDQHGNRYSSLNIKGCDLSNPHFYKTLTAARDYIIYGLQESIVMERIVQASNILRAAEVGTEYICGLVMPTSFPLDTKATGLDTKRPVELPELLEHLAERFAGDQENHPDTSALEAKVEMIERFKDCHYLITYRAMDTPFRFKELANSQNYAAFQDFSYDHNGTHKNSIGAFIKKHEMPNYVKRLFAPNLGKNVAKMHDAGLYHGFLVEGNITALGSIVDLDSCRGEPLGLDDKPITQLDMFKDVAECLRTISEVLGKHSYDTSSSRINRQEAQKYIHWAAQNFLRFYVEERFDKKAERKRFLEEFLLHAPQTKDKYEEKNQLHVYDLAQQVIDTYNNTYGFSPSEEPIALPQRAPQLKRSQTILKAVPPKFMRDMSLKLNDEDWTLNELHAKEIKTKRPIYSPLRTHLQNLTIEHIISQQADEQQTRLTGAQLLYLVGCSFDRPRPRSATRKQIKAQTLDAYKQARAAVVEQLGQFEPQMISSSLKPFFDSGALTGLEENVGSMDLSINGKHDTDILYLEDDEQYLRVFKALGINSKSDIFQFDQNILHRLILSRRSLKEDCIIIADYALALHVGECTSLAEQKLSLLGKYYEDIKATLMVYDLKSNRPIVSVIPNRFIDYRKAVFSFDELSELVVPSLAGGSSQRLVDVPTTAW